MRVLLIRPNSTWRATYIPVGLGYIADAVRRAGHEVSILDARVPRQSLQQVVGYVDDYAPDVVGLSAVHVDPDVQGTRELARALKRLQPRYRIVLGGPLASTMGEDFVRDGSLDVAVVGEGERTFTRYLDALAHANALDEIPGLVYRQGDETRVNAPGPFIDELDDVTPAWDLLGLDRYFTPFRRSGMSVMKRSQRSVPIFTSRGCPFGCTYCHRVFGRKFRPRSPDSVLSEISALKERYGIREIEIVDDCFNLDLERAKEIVREIIRRKLDIAICFPNALRADRMDRELIDLLKEAGTYQIRYAVETASPRLQKLIHKNLDLERTREVISYTAEKGLYMLGFFMLGFPTETAEEMRQTIDYAVQSKLHAAMFFYVTPFPGTEMCETFCPAGPPSDVESMSYTDLRVNLSRVSSEELRKISREAYRRFYFSPGRMLRTLRVVPKNFSSAWSALIAVMLSARDTKDW